MGPDSTKEVGVKGVTSPDVDVSSSGPDPSGDRGGTTPGPAVDHRRAGTSRADGGRPRTHPAPGLSARLVETPGPPPRRTWGFQTHTERFGRRDRHTQRGGVDRSGTGGRSGHERTRTGSTMVPADRPFLRLFDDDVFPVGPSKDHVYSVSLGPPKGDSRDCVPTLLRVPSPAVGVQCV